MATRKKEAKLTTFYIENQLDISNYILTADKSQQQMLTDALQSAQSGNIKLLMQYFALRLAYSNLIIEEAYGILHNADTKKTYDEKTGTEIETQVTLHYHIVCKLKKGNGATLAELAKALGLNQQQIEKPRAGRYSYDDKLAYLIHIKYADKHHYDANEVVAIGSYTYLADGRECMSFDTCDNAGNAVVRSYMDIYAERRSAWEKGAATVKMKQAKGDIDWLEDKILHGKINKETLLKDDTYFEIYARNMKRCNDAFAAFLERKALEVKEAMFNDEFKMSVFYITGQPGRGKSHFTDMMVRAIADWSEKHDELRWSSYDAAASNGMDDYNGEEILVMDDLNGMSLRAEDWLKLLDPRRVAQVSARFHNKTPICRVIFIVSKFHPVTFFSHLTSKNEPIDQFLRRMEGVVKVIDYDDINYYRMIEETTESNERYTEENTNIAQPNLCSYYGRYHLDETAWHYDAENMQRRLLSIIETNNKPIATRNAECDISATTA